MISIYNVLEFSWFFLFALALLFLGLELRCKFDKAFLYHGAALLLLCAFTAVDLWILPDADLDSSLLYYRLQHLTFLFFSCFTLTNVLVLIGKKRQFFVSSVYMFSMVLSVLTFTPLIWKIKNQQIDPGILYLPLYGFFFPFVVVSLVYFIVSGLKSVAPSEKRILVTHLIGLILLAVFGLLDFLFAAFPELKFIASSTQIGTFIYGLTVSSIFMDRFLHVLRDRASAFSKLESAYRELETANNLREIGESTAIVNHEIKNYMFMISGNAQILREMEPLTLKGQELVGNIITSVDRMSQFSRDILEMSKAQIFIEKHPINVVSLIEGVIRDHFSAQAKFIEMDCEVDSNVVQADWGRFEQIFINLIKNALDATPKDSLPRIQIRIRANVNVVLMSVEDNGIGCAEEQCENFFKAFYTTKKGHGGTGLGLSIVRSIVESHGGKINAYSKNFGGSGNHGIRIQMSFPNFVRDGFPGESLSKIIIIRKDFPELVRVMQIIKNICATPVLIDSVEELLSLKGDGHQALILVSPKALSQKATIIREYPNINLLAQQGKTIFVMDKTNSRQPEILSEEFLFDKMIEFRSGRRSRAPLERHATSIV